MTYPLLITQFLRRARDFHSNKDIVSLSGGKELRYSYGSYYERVTRLARVLQELGVRPGERVATFAWNHHQHLELYFAAPLAGAVLHTINIRWGVDDIRHSLDHAGTCLLFADTSLLAALGDVRKRMPELTVISMGVGESDENLRYEDLLAEAEPIAEMPELDESDPAALCYTSGTTGQPRGVLYSHRTLFLHTMAACMADGHAISEQDTVLHVVPMFHANAWGIPLAATACGAKQVLPGKHPSPATVASLIETEEVTYVGMVPTVAVDVLNHLRTKGGDLTSLRCLVLGGSTPPRDLIRAYEDEVGIPVYQGWGMTELAAHGTFSRPTWDMAEWPPDKRYEVAQKQGRLLPGLEWKLLDDDGNELPWDGIHQGELLVRGAWAATQYYRNEAQETFPDGWLRTGDIATIDADGFMQIVDRKKDVIKSGGEWISSIVLEQAAASHSSVGEIAVISTRHERWQERPLAVVVPDQRASIEWDETELRMHLAKRVPKWWLPEHIVTVPELPKTGTGKVDKARLRTQFGGHEEEDGA